MTEEEKATDRRPNGESTGSGLFEELDTLGHELATAFKALWESEDSRRVRQELQDGFVELGRQIDAAVRSVQESDASRQLGEQVKEAVGKARETDVVGKVEEGLLVGLRELNAQLSQWVDSLQGEAEKAETKAETEAQAEGSE